MISIDYSRALLVVETTLRAYRKRDYPYHNIRLPQDEIPDSIRNDPLIFARLLFYSCLYMRGTIKSSFAMKQMIAMFLAWPELFNPYLAKDFGVEDIEPFLARYIPYRSMEIARFWIENSRRLALRWDGDPRLIFGSARSAGKVYRFVTNRDSVKIKSRTDAFREDGFLGFQKKMTGMLAYFLESCGLIEPMRIEIRPPVDFHHIRIARATRMIVVSPRLKTARYESMFPIVMRLYGRLMKDLHLGMRELGDMFWIISERLCSASPATETRGGAIVSPDWDDATTRERHLRTCGECPLEGYCEFAIPAATYYEDGFFVLHERRARYPHPGHLFQGAAIYPPKISAPRCNALTREAERQGSFGFLLSDNE